MSHEGLKLHRGHSICRMSNHQDNGSQHSCKNTGLYRKIDFEAAKTKVQLAERKIQNHKCCSLMCPIDFCIQTGFYQVDVTLDGKKERS